MQLLRYSLLLALVAGLFASTAQAATPRQQVKTLKHRVALLTKTNAQLRQQDAALATQNAGLTSQAASLTNELSSTQSLLGTMTQERNEFKTERDALQSQVDSTPTELQRALVVIRADVAYSQHVLANSGTSLPEGYLTSVAAMNYVVGHVSAPNFGYRHEIASLPLPWTAEMDLEMQAGICGNAADTFGVIMKQLGYQVRSVQFYYGSNNHIADEVFYADSWHYFDPTWDAVFTNGTDALSIDQARSGPFTLLRDQTQLWTLVNENRGNQSGLEDLSVLTDPTTVVTIDQMQFGVYL